MRIRDPFALELTYTRGIMCFLLFKRNVKNMLTIGLGGGSVAKYTYKNCPEIISTIIEINSKVIQILGSKDIVFPVKYSKPDYVVANGTHLFPATKPKQVSKILNEIFK